MIAYCILLPANQFAPPLPPFPIIQEPQYTAGPHPLVNLFVLSESTAYVPREAGICAILGLRCAIYRNPFFGAQSKDCAPYSRIVHMICSHARAQSWNTVSKRWTSKNRSLMTAKEAKRSSELKERICSRMKGI